VAGIRSRGAKVTAGDEPTALYERQFARARTKISPYAFAYCNGAAGDERAADDNVRALDEVRLIPRVLRGATAPDTSTALLGHTLAVPVLVAPMGLQRLLHPGGEAVTAAGARSADAGFCLSMFSSVSAAEVAEAAPELRLQQIYLTRDAQITDAVVAAAVAHGLAGLVVTVDVPAVASRSYDAGHTQNRFDEVSPAMLELPGVRDRLAACAPVGAGSGQLLSSVFPAPENNWETLREFVARSPLPVLVKGVLHPEDAATAVAVGAAGVVVSNHGGRQLDRVVPAIGRLGPVVEAVGGSVPVLFDSGVRRGSHVVAALALGATAVLLGRPVLWGLASGGEDGVRDTLRQVVGEVRETMTMIGSKDIADLRGRALMLSADGEPSS